MKEMVLQHKDEQILDLHLAKCGMAFGYHEYIRDVQVYLTLRKYFSDEDVLELISEEEYRRVREFVKCVMVAAGYIEGVEQKVIDADDCTNGKFRNFIAVITKMGDAVVPFKRLICMMIQNSSMRDYSLTLNSHLWAKNSNPHLEMGAADKEAVEMFNRKEAEQRENG